MRRALLVLSAVALLVFVGSAQAAIVTVGSPMTGNYTSGNVGVSSALFNTKVPGNTTSPVTGAVIGWNVLGAAGGPFTLRVITPVNGGTEYVGGGHGAPDTPISTAFTHFSADLPIQAGSLVAFDHPNFSDQIGFGTALAAGGKIGFFTSPLAEGATEAPFPTPTSGEAAFNAEVQPAPVVQALGTTSGPQAGGTSVLIAGTDLENTTAVTFGGTPATFTADGEGSVLATSPPSASAASVPITVTTLAGSSTSAQTFSYVASPPSPTSTNGGSSGPTSTPTSSLEKAAPVKCKVPNLAGKKLKAAKSKLTAAHCAIGKVTKQKGATLGSGKVVKQAPKPGASLAAGTKVKVTLGG